MFLFFLFVCTCASGRGRVLLVVGKVCFYVFEAEASGQGLSLGDKQYDNMCTGILCR